VTVASLGTRKKEHAVINTPPKLGHPLITFYLTNSTATTLLQFSCLHMSHISRPFDLPLLDRFITLCCIVQSANSIRNTIHPLLLAPSAPVCFYGKASDFVQAVTGSNLPERRLP
jgi:hypothetical protein